VIEEYELQKRITSNPAIFGGKPIIRGRRLAIAHVLGFMKDGATVEEILEEYEWLECEDIEACIEWNRIHGM